MKKLGLVIDTFHHLLKYKFGFFNLNTNGGKFECQ
jgi:hypothetical protein